MEFISCIQTGMLGVNTYIVSSLNNSANASHDVFVVDPGGDANIIVEAINEMNGTLIGIVLTHGHFDHVGALASLKELYPEVPVCMHEADSIYVGNNGYDTHRSLFAKIGFDGGDFFTHSKMPEVDVSLAHNVKLPFSQEWVVIHTPGHTEGSICLYNETQKALISGDTLFKMSYGRTDLPGGSFTKLKKSLELLFSLPVDTKVYPGHESTTTIGQEMNMHL